MTTVLARPAPAVWSIGAPRLLAGLDQGPLDLPTHLAVHGPLPGYVAGDRDRLIELIDRARIVGRGGAGFPLAAKLRSLRRDERPVVVVNASESEPASRKDRTVLTLNPHLVLDGATVLAHAIDARRVIVAVADPEVARLVEQAIAQRPERRTLSVVRGPHTFVSGEARAVVRGIEGGRAVPPGRRILPTVRGVRGAPTLVSNVETVAQVAVLVRTGSADFARTGVPDEPGTTLLSVCGAVTRPGVVEIPIGTPLSVALAAAGVGPVAALVVGGYHGGWMTPDPAMPLSRAGVAAAGGTFGAGVIGVVGTDTCALGELGRVTEWLAAQSAGQCGPCRFGLPALAADVIGAWQGDPHAARNAHRHATAVDGRGACAHPDGAARFVTSGLRVLAAEIDQHRRHGSCGRPILGHLPLGATA